MLETGQVLEVRGRQVELQRKGSGAPLLFLHGVQGLSVVHGSWPAFLDRLAESFDVIAPSHPGFGATEATELTDSVEDIVFHYLDLLEALGLSSVSVVGHSFGAWVGAELAVAAPPVVDRLVLANPLGIWLEDTPMPDIFMFSPPEVTELAWADRAAAEAATPADADEGEQWYADWSSLALYGWNPFLHNPKLRERIHRVTAPTLVVGSSEDGITPPVYAKAFSELIAGSKVEIVQGASHALPLEQPDKLAGIVTGFLNPSS